MRVLVPDLQADSLVHVENRSVNKCHARHRVNFDPESAAAVSAESTMDRFASGCASCMHLGGTFGNKHRLRLDADEVHGDYVAHQRSELVPSTKKACRLREPPLLRHALQWQSSPFSSPKPPFAISLIAPQLHDPELNRSCKRVDGSQRQRKSLTVNICLAGSHGVGVCVGRDGIGLWANARSEYRPELFKATVHMNHIRNRMISRSLSKGFHGHMTSEPTWFGS